MELLRTILKQSTIEGERMPLELIGEEECKRYGFTIISGPNSQGKTTLAQNIAVNAAKKGIGCLFISNEHFSNQTANRIASICDGYTNLPIYIEDRCSTKTDLLMAIGVCQGFVYGTPKIIIIDNLDRIKNVDNDSIYELQDIASRLNLRIVGVIRMKEDESGDPHPKLKNVMLDTTAADIVYLTNIEHDTAIKIICAKARYSDTFERVYQFDKCSGKIGELIKL